ncbi:hypothetical protein DICPUDRAFT_76423 [Dictyostelium purpureum]|uniref:Uncharacterized protein n=1 Tax=Dictyostelium purpureum TaxID=5786 RepID=F0ZDK2_DICPU|nr:uncharacterized protein DICPUDRAFT_76423 [Dictyostelium purpureum]EGC37995.1 hypothetical protein DICPUDRAFT_76423 [Dictyostelium purpureum]|eukprot:XP_003285479.1 hypothetical protein DICPUDRAFT_76423 [Dictyostelium purpureum]
MKYFIIFNFFYFFLIINITNSLIIEKSNAFYNENSDKWSLDIITSTNDNKLKAIVDISNNDDLGLGLGLGLEIEKSFIIKLNLNYFGSFENVYDDIRNEFKDPTKCVQLNGIHCCDKTKGTQISHNYASNYSTPYLFYEIKSFSIEYNMTFTTPNGVVGSWNSDNSSDISLGIKDQSNLNYIDELIDTYYLTIDQQSNTIYFIAKKYVGDDINKIGITKETFENYNSFCNLTKSITTVGDSSNRFDQFDIFRNNLLDNFIVGCKLNSFQQISNLQNEDLILLCDTLKVSNKIVSSVSIDFNSNKFKLFNISGNSRVISSGIVPISLQINKYFSNLYIDFLNDNINNEVLIKARAIYCSNGDENETNASSLNGPLIDQEKTISINSFNKKRIEFPIKSRDKEISSSGYCIFDIFENEQFKEEYRVNFRTTEDDYVPDPKFQIDYNMNMLLSATKDSTCTPPKIGGNKNGVNYCIDECTIDQQINMFTLACIPIDCNIKYSTESPPKPYYNSNTGLCESTPVCPDGYSYQDNTCKSPTITPDSSSISFSCENGNLCGSDSLSSGDPITTPNITGNSNATNSSISLSSKTIGIIFILCCVVLIVVVGFLIKKCCFSRSANKKIKRDKLHNHLNKPPTKPKENTNESYGHYQNNPNFIINNRANNRFNQDYPRPSGTNIRSNNHFSYNNNQRSNASYNRNHRPFNNNSNAYRPNCDGTFQNQRSVMNRRDITYTNNNQNFNK